MRSFKKLYLLSLLALFFTFSLFGCGATESPSSRTDNGNSDVKEENDLVATGEDRLLSESRLNELTGLELSALKDTLATVYNAYHDTTSGNNRMVRDLVEPVVEDHLNSDQGTVSWPIFDYTYSRDRDLYTLKTHVDYKDNGGKYNVEVYAEVYSVTSSPEIIYLTIGTNVIIDARERISENGWANKPAAISVDDLDLLLLSTEEVEEFQERVNDEIKNNHRPVSKVETKILELTKAEVERQLGDSKTDLSWPWLDYTYTREWDYYTLKTSVTAKGNKGKYNYNVDASAYPEDGEYVLFYLSIGNDVIIDRKSELPESLWGGSFEIVTGVPTVEETASETHVQTDSVSETERESEAPTTEAPTTEAPTTEAPTTEATTTEAPTTEAPTTEAPTTEAPTTEAPTTEAPKPPVQEAETRPFIPETTAPEYTQLRKGSSGDAVTEIQRRLTELGYDPNGIDGSFGDGTAAALRAFQERNGLSGTGVATVETQKRLFSASARTAEPVLVTPETEAVVVVREPEPEPYYEPVENWVTYYSTANLNVRSGPGTNSGIVGQLQEGDSISVSSVENGWARIQYQNGIAYVSAAYITDTYVPPAPAVIILTPTPEPAYEEEPIVRAAEPEPDPVYEGYVWVTANGKRYHNDPDCSNMKNPSLIPLSEAMWKGYTPCQKCY